MTGCVGGDHIAIPGLIDCDGRDGRRLVEPGSEIDERDGELLQFVFDHAGDRVTADAGDENRRTSEVGEGDGCVGGGSAYVHFLTFRHGFGVPRKELVHLIDDVDGR